MTTASSVGSKVARGGGVGLGGSAAVLDFSSGLKVPGLRILF